MNVVPFIDVLLVLLVIFMIIPHKQSGLTVELPQPATELPADPQPTAIVIEVFADGALRINQEAVEWDGLRGRRSEEHTSELQSHSDLVCRLLLEKKKI